MWPQSAQGGYIQGIAREVASGALDLEALRHAPDEELIRELSALNGIGVWTAEMLMIFSLCRPDVLSWGDLGIRRGMALLYGDRELTRERFERRRKRYSPYGSVVSLYLWSLAGMEEALAVSSPKADAFRFTENGHGIGVGNVSGVVPRFLSVSCCLSALPRCAV